MSQFIQDVALTVAVMFEKTAWQHRASMPPKIGDKIVHDVKSAVNVAGDLASRGAKAVGSAVKNVAGKVRDKVRDFAGPSNSAQATMADIEKQIQDLAKETVSGARPKLNKIMEDIRKMDAADTTAARLRSKAQRAASQAWKSTKETASKAVNKINPFKKKAAFYADAAGNVSANPYAVGGSNMLADAANALKGRYGKAALGLGVGAAGLYGLSRMMGGGGSTPPPGGGGSAPPPPPPSGGGGLAWFMGKKKEPARAAAKSPWLRRALMGAGVAGAGLVGYNMLNKGDGDGQ